MDSQQFEQSLNESLEFYGRVREEKGISITSLTREVTEGLVIYTAVGKMGDRTDSATGAVSIEGLKGLEKADAFKAAETQAKSRLTISLSGVRIERVPSVPEPTALDAPTASNEKAEVVSEAPDTRTWSSKEAARKQLIDAPVPYIPPGPMPVEIGGPAIVDVMKPLVRITLADVTNMPIEMGGPVIVDATKCGSTTVIAGPIPGVYITEAMISKIHDEAKILDAPEPKTVEQQVEGVPVSEPAKPLSTTPIAIDGQNSIFDEEPDVLVAPTPPPPPALKPEPVDAVLAAVQQITSTGVTMPIPVPKPADQPTRLQFQGFTIRCGKIVKQLNAAGKDAPGALMPYLRKVFGTKELSPETTSILLWESTLTALETAGSPAATFKILKEIKLKDLEAGSLKSTG